MHLLLNASHCCCPILEDLQSAVNRAELDAVGNHHDHGQAVLHEESAQTSLSPQLYKRQSTQKFRKAP